MCIFSFFVLLFIFVGFNYMFDSIINFGCFTLTVLQFIKNIWFSIVDHSIITKIIIFFIGITRDRFHKRRNTSGKIKTWRKKRKFQIGRPPAMTHLGGHRVHSVRCRGGIIKYRALRLETGNFSWGTQCFIFRLFLYLVIIF
jgi:hypothetical protein